MKFVSMIAVIAGALLSSTSVQAAGQTTARISRITSYNGHTGLLVIMSSPHQNADNCTSSVYYIFPDTAARADVVQSMLLSAQMSGKMVELVVDGCYEGFPRIVHVTVIA